MARWEQTQDSSVWDMKSPNQKKPLRPRIVEKDLSIMRSSHLHTKSVVHSQKALKKVAYLRVCKLNLAHMHQTRCRVPRLPHRSAHACDEVVSSRMAIELTIRFQRDPNACPEIAFVGCQSCFGSDASVTVFKPCVQVDRSLRNLRIAWASRVSSSCTTICVVALSHVGQPS